MAERQNTKNAIPSNALADLNDNSMIIDEFVNSSSDSTEDRFGNQIRTITKIQKDVNSIIAGSGFLPLVGGTLSGSLTFDGNGRGIYFSPANHRIISGNGVDLSFDMVGSNGSRNGRLDWLTSTDTWNFKNSTVTINNTPVLKQGDYGLGGTTANIISGSIDQDLSTGFYLVNSGTTGNTPFSACNLLVHSRNSSLKTAIALDASRNAAPFNIKNGVYTNGSWQWQELITTANIKEYINSSSSIWNRVQITENGSFIVPDGVHEIYVSAIGGGGGSSGRASTSITSRQGGSGSAIYRYLVNVTPGSIINISIGAGGAGGPSSGSNQGDFTGRKGGTTTIDNGDFKIDCLGGGGGVCSWSSNVDGQNGSGDFSRITQNLQVKNIGQSTNLKYTLGFADFGIYGEAASGSGRVNGNPGNAGVVILEW